MRLVRLVIAATAVLSFGATPAFADWSNGSQAYATRPDGKPANASGWFEGNVKYFGLPDERNKIGEFPKLGGALEGSVFRAQGTAGPCSGSVGVGNISAKAELGIGIDTTGLAGGPSWRGNGERPSGRFSPPAKNGQFDGGGMGRSGLVQCSIGAEASLLSLKGECETAVGTFAGSASGVGAQAGCTCEGVCSAEAYWAKAGIDYTTPPIGGCGLKVSATVGAEVMLGAGIGIGKAGDIGAQGKLGPVGVKAGLNIEEFDPGKMGDCVVQAAEAVADAAVAVGEAAYDAGKAAVNAVGDAASAVGEGIADAASAVGEGLSDAADAVGEGLSDAGCAIASLWGGCDDDEEEESSGGTTVAGGSSNTPGVAMNINAPTAATAANIGYAAGITPGSLPPGTSSGGQQGTGYAAPAGMARD